MTLNARELRSPNDVQIAFAEMAQSHPDALIVPSDGRTLSDLQTIVDLAAKMKLPAIYQTREFVEAGGLMS